MPEHTLRHQLKEFESELAGAKSALAKAVGSHEIEVRALKARITILERALGEAKLQLEYLDERFPTGTTPAVLTRIRDVLSDAKPRPTLVGNWTEKL